MSDVTELLAELRDDCACAAIAAAGMVKGPRRCTYCYAADALTAQAEEIARLTRERDEAQAKERERCARIVEDPTFGALADKREIAAAIRGGKP